MIRRLMKVVLFPLWILVVVVGGVGFFLAISVGAIPGYVITGDWYASGDWWLDLCGSVVDRWEK